MKFLFTEAQLKNLLIFLNRIDYKGLQEVHAINEITSVLNNPIVDTENHEVTATHVRTPMTMPAPLPQPMPE